jgi:hypothetical protein
MEWMLTLDEFLAFAFLNNLQQIYIHCSAQLLDVFLDAQRFIRLFLTWAQPLE